MSIKGKTSIKVVDDFGYHHFPVGTCKAHNGTAVSHIILRLRVLSDGTLSIDYQEFCEACYAFLFDTMNKIG